MPKKNTSSRKMARVASTVLRSKNSSKVSRRLAGSVLSQTPKPKRRK